MLEMELLVERIVNEVYSRMQTGDVCGTLAPSGNNIARMIDHTLLKQDASDEQIVKLCREAKQFGFASVCVNPSNVPLAYSELRGTAVKVCTVIGFPLGATTVKTKVYETMEAIENGAAEVDMVINVGMVKSGNWDGVKSDIEAVVIAASGKALVKVIIETCLLTDEEKVQVCTICREVGADFVKTSTGFSTGGAKVEDIALMRKTVGSDMGVKASGGVKDAAFAKALIAAGATRLGTSSGKEIIQGQTGKSAY